MMKTKLIALSVAAVMLLNFAAFGKTDDRKKAVGAKRQVSRLTTMLPASDGIALFEAQRFLNDALPRVFAANQPVLEQIRAKLTEIQTKTGVDLSKFHQVAVGVSFKQLTDGKIDFEPIVLAGGDVNVGGLSYVAKLATAGSYREETIAGHTVYIFSSKALVKSAATQAPGTDPGVTALLNDTIDKITMDVAVTALDNNTLAMGTLDRVRETLEGKTHVGADLTSLLAQRETSIASFAIKPTGGMAKLIPLGDDDLGKDLDGIRYLSGAVDFSPTGGTLSLSAKTEKPEQAENLRNTIDGLRMLGKAVFGASKRADQQLYSRLIENAKVTQRLNTLSLQLTVPQADLDKLVALIK